MTTDWDKMPAGPPGLVFGLKHTASDETKAKVFSWDGKDYDPEWAFRAVSGNAPDCVQDALVPEGFEPYFGGDINGGPGQGFYWFESTRSGNGAVAMPPSVVLGLKHSRNQSLKKVANQYDPVEAWKLEHASRLLGDSYSGPSPQESCPPGFIRPFNVGDLGAKRGVGYYYYASDYPDCGHQAPPGLAFALDHYPNSPYNFWELGSHPTLYHPIAAWCHKCGRPTPPFVEMWNNPLPEEYDVFHAPDLGATETEWDGFYWIERVKF